MKALICGISGQDGTYLAELLLQKGYEVWGTSRDAQISRFENLRRLGILESVNLVSMAINDFRSVLEVLTRLEPDELYNLAGQSSVQLSFEQPMETLESITTGTLNLLEVIRHIGVPMRLYNASSSECFGNTTSEPANENTPFRPRSPYAVAKAAAHWAVANYREAYGLYACSGILFNHESPLRPTRFVTRKITTTATRIANGNKEKLMLGNLSIVRDWGWAPEYVEAIWGILQQEQPDDFVIATGESHSLEEFVESAFQLLGLNWRDHVVQDKTLFRPSEIAASRGDPSKAEAQMGWIARTHMKDVVSKMIRAEQEAQNPGKEEGSRQL